MSDGPDQIRHSNEFITTDLNKCVRLRLTENTEVKPISVPTLLKQAVEKAPENLTALAVKRDGEWKKWTFKEYLKDVEQAAKAFIHFGLESRNSVAICGFNSPEWFIADLAAVHANAIAVGVYPTNSAETSKFILQDSKANIAVVEDDKQLKKLLQILSHLPLLKLIVQYVGEPNEKNEECRIISWNELMKTTTTNDELESRLKDVCINEVCHLVYTSGTTGPPKGVMLNHDNLIYTAKALCKRYDLQACNERIVSYLPLSHVAANMTDLFLGLASTSSVYFADRDALKGSLVDTLKEVHPTFFLGVPRVWEKIRDRLVEVGRANKGFKKQIAKWAKEQGLKHNKKLLNDNMESGKSLNFLLAEKLVFKKVKLALGLDKCVHFFSAAAPLSIEVLEFFLSLDIRILEIYGMSECSGPQLSNWAFKRKLGTCGDSLPGFHTRIGNYELPLSGGGNYKFPLSEGLTGEICMSGRNVMMGYLNRAEETFEAFDGLWLRSGDIGRTDEQGFVAVTGRIKELLITAGGENIAPIPIEETIKKNLPCLSNVVLIGDKKKFLSCLIAFKTEVNQDTLLPLPQLSSSALDWCENVAKSKAQTVLEAQSDPHVKSAIDSAMIRVNESASSNAQKVQKWSILPQDLSIPNGELGPTLKIKRHVVEQNYKHIINEFYG